MTKEKQALYALKKSNSLLFYLWDLLEDHEDEDYIRKQVNEQLAINNEAMKQLKEGASHD